MKFTKIISSLLVLGTFLLFLTACQTFSKTQLVVFESLSFYMPTKSFEEAFGEPNEVVEETKKIISRTYKTYINDIKEIRNISNGSYTQQMVESLYFKIDQPFRQWLASIQPEDNKDSKIQEWRVLLKKIVKAEAEVILHQGGTRDYLGIQKDGRIKNIATAYNSFDFWLRQQLK